ncbi:MAG: hypothetical protein AAFR61_11630 [Bacteroidota bacterium]
MKKLVLLVLGGILCLTACNPNPDFPPLPPASTVDCQTYVPFYEKHDSTVSSLRVTCDCQDSTIDLAGKLAPYQQLTQLYFDCDADKFDQLPELPTVTHLITEVTTQNITAFRNLEKLENKVYMKEELSPQILFLTKLREVVLYNAINVPSTIRTGSFEHFSMTFEHTAVQPITLPENLELFHNLHELDIRNVDLAIFSDFDQLTSLEHLKISGSLWVRIPSEPNQWPQLKTLEVSNARLRGDIPDMFRDMDSLKTVYIGDSPLTTESQQHIFQAPAIEELTFSFCEMGTIPDEIGDATSLKQLIITAEPTALNPLSLPSTIANLNQLESIFLSIQTDAFPTALLGLKNSLQSLAIKDPIGAIPAQIGEFTALTTLNLQNCSLTFLPAQIQQLAPTLKKLLLSGNNFDETAKQQIQTWLPDTEITF